MPKECGSNFLISNLVGYQLRLSKFEGRDHIVVPVVMLTEGVHSGSGGALYYPAEELAKFPAAWDGRPVPVLHPEGTDGMPVSCNSPDVLENRSVGRVFNTRFADGKLTAQLWLDVQRLSKIDPELLLRLNAREPIEVSTGLFLEVDNQTGEWEGESYIGIARDFRPDHLALLPVGAGACSLADGCGIRVNSADEYKKIMASWARLVAHEKSYMAVLDAVRTAVDAMDRPGRDGGQGVFHYMQEVTDSYVVYSREDADGARLLKQDYKINEDGTVSLEGEPVAVRMERTYVEVDNNKGGTNVKKEEMIKYLTDNGCQCSADQLQGLEEAVLANMVKTTEKAAEAASALKANQEEKDKELAALKAENEALKANKSDDEPPATVDEYIAAAPAEMQTVLNRAVARDRKAKQDLVEKLAANQKVYTKDELSGMALEGLEKLAALAAVHNTDFRLAGASVQASSITEEPLLSPTLNFGTQQ